MNVYRNIYEFVTINLDALSPLLCCWESLAKILLATGQRTFMLKTYLRIRMMKLLQLPTSTCLQVAESSCLWSDDEARFGRIAQWLQ